MNPPRKTRRVRIESLEARSMFAADAMPWMPMPSLSMDKGSAWSGEPIASTRDSAGQFDRGPSPFHLDNNPFEAMGRMDRFDSRGGPSRTGLQNTWSNPIPMQVEIVVLTLPSLRNSELRSEGLRPDSWIITSWASSSTILITSKPRINEIGGMNSASASIREPFNGENSGASVVRDRASISTIESPEPLSQPISGNRASASVIHSVSTLTGAWLSGFSAPAALASTVWNVWVQSDVSLLSKLDSRAMPGSEVARRARESANTGDVSSPESRQVPISKGDRWSGTDREISVDQAFADWAGRATRQTPTHRARVSRFEPERTAVPGVSKLPGNPQATDAVRDRMLLMRIPRAMRDEPTIGPTIGEETKPVQLLSSFGSLPPIARTLNHEGMLSHPSNPEPHGTHVVSWPGSAGSLSTAETREPTGRSGDEALNGASSQRGLYAAATTVIVSAWMALQTRRAARSTAQSEGSEAIVVRSNVQNRRSE